MNSARRRAAGVCRANKSGSEDQDLKAAESLSAPPSAAACSNVTDNTTTWRRAGKSKTCSPAPETEGMTFTNCGLSTEREPEDLLVVTTDNEQRCPRQNDRRKGGMKRKREMSGSCTEAGYQQVEEEEEDEMQPEVEIDPELDRELENKSRQHNLTSANVRSIIHEVITNEHVVAMMKAAISETETVPLFEPKMTRSKLKEVVEKGVVIPTWNISPIKKPSKEKGPQFVDIPLEEEDSSDEEYCPDEEDDDETAEDTFLESDLESTASSPRGTRINLNRSHSDYDGENGYSPRQSVRRARHLRVEVVPMGPPPPPQAPEPPVSSRECSFMEKLHAVDEELAFGSECMDSYQSLGSNAEESLMAFRTRSKRPLRDVPLGRLEAELRAPDITPDMYEHGCAPEDREWTRWLQGLMNSDTENEEEGDDDDDPEYNFLADIDEPDVEDYRNDKAVRITKKEVNDLMEELFVAFQDELGGQDEEVHEEEEEKEEDDIPQPDQPSVLETIEYEDPLADVLKQRYRTVKEHLAALRTRKALLESKGVPIPPPPPKRPTSPTAPLFLSPDQKLQLQQQIQQHVQLLTQVNMLIRSVEGLQNEVCTTRQFLSELQFFAERDEQTRCVVEPGFVSIFRTCNLQAALSLLEELDEFPKMDPVQAPVLPGCQFPAYLAWLMATRPVFLYPQLLPEVNLCPSRYKGPFTSAEQCLVILGHQHFKGTVDPLKLTSHYLLVSRNFICLRTHVRIACYKSSSSILKEYFLEGKCPHMPLTCERVSPNDQRPPVERERRLMPCWLSENLQLIYDQVKKYNQTLVDCEQTSKEKTTPTFASSSFTLGPSSPSYSFPPGTCCPPRLPESLASTLRPQPERRRPPPPRKKAPPKLSVQSHNFSKYTQLLKVRGRSLGRLLPILPKLNNTSVQRSVQPHHSGGQTLQVKTHSETSKSDPPCTEATNANSNGETEMTASDIRDSIDLSQGKLLVTLPVAPVAVCDISETVSSAGAPAGPIQGNVILTLPTAPVVTAFICPTPSSNIVSQTPSVFPSTSAANEHMSLSCGTLLKLNTGVTPPANPASLNPVTPNTLHQLLILPPGCVVTNSTGCQSSILNTQPNTSHSQEECLAQETMSMEQITQNSSGNISQSIEFTQSVLVDRLPKTDPSGYEEDSIIERHCVQGILEEKEWDINEEQEECSEDFRKPFLTLSESSGSPVSSLAGEDDAMEMMDRHMEFERKKGMEGDTNERENLKNSMCTVKASLLAKSDVQNAVEKLPNLNSEPRSGIIGLLEADKSDGHVSGSEEPGEESTLSDNLSDDDPLRDVKDVAFAHAYLKKACEVLKAVPGKVEEFLSVLYEFERDPDGRTSVELFIRLKPVLSNWPELLRDFAAFLDPEQAQECGLLEEQQAFERSRSFLRQLELTFGEHSAHYRRVVHTLQKGSEEMKAQIAMLFCDHEHLLDEFWMFFKQLHPTVQSYSDDGEEEEEEKSDDTDSVSSIQTVCSMDGSQLGQTVSTMFSEERDAHNSQTPNKQEVCIITQDAEGRYTESYLSALGPPVCAKNSSLMPDGERIVLWTREADRVILTTCQQRGASQSTFNFIAAQFGNKTANEVGARYQNLIRLFHTTTKQHHASQLDREASSSPKEEEPD